ncbi:MAG: tripartite tricarboxylate transporter substrate binding protein [Betaproteobacteria bacterium]|nr:tripartite tricarboxylate transporter substrate binding protein [Betaproteobacteria bacterium]
MTFRKLLVAIAVLAWPFHGVTHAAQADAFPDKPIRLIIGSAPGSGPDIIARLIAEHLVNAWGKQVVVDPRPGVAGIISAEQALRANPDGYTWLLVTSQLFIATSGVYPNLKFDLDRDFPSIAMIGLVPYILLTNPKLPADSVPELIALAKKSPGALRHGSGGTGGGEHFTMEMFKRAAGINIVHVPYKGIVQALLDVMANQIQVSFAVFPVGKPHVDSGRLRALGVTTAKRVGGLPDAPAISETLPGYDTFGWYSVVAPRGTPEAVLAKSSAEVLRGIRQPAFADKLRGHGIEITAGGRKELDQFRAQERKRFTALVKATGAIAQ